MAKGLRGLVAELPFGEFLFDVAEDVQKQLREEELRDAIQQVAQPAPADEVHRAAEQVAHEVAAGQPAAVQQALSIYLSLIPSAVRQSLKRPDDPTGTTVPAMLALSRPEDLMVMLPAGPPRFRPGERPPALGGWELVDLLGVGGFGEVWLARNVSFPAMRAAVKFCLDAAARERFLKHEGQLVQRAMQAQSRLTAQPHGDGVVHLLDANLTTDPPWLRYEYVEGSDLSGLVRNWANLKGPERAKGATVVIRRLARVVGQFHRLPEPIIHRDLKPANILVNRGADGKMSLRICDFGISQVAARQAIELSRRSTPSLSVAPTLRGAHTPLYASPQQKLMKQPDVRDDVFALGVMWYQLMLGDVTQERPAGKWRKRMANLEVDEALLDLLEACVDNEPDERPKDAAELAERLAIKQAPSVPSTPTAVLTPPPLPNSVGSWAEAGGEDVRTSGSPAVSWASELADQQVRPKSQSVRQTEAEGKREARPPLDTEPCPKCGSLVGAFFSGPRYCKHCGWINWRWLPKAIGWMVASLAAIGGVAYCEYWDLPSRGSVLFTLRNWAWVMIGLSALAFVLYLYQLIDFLRFYRSRHRE